MAEPGGRADHGFDPEFSGPFDEDFRSEGARVILAPIRAPNANAYAERFIRTIRAECLDWILILGGHHLRRPSQGPTT